MPYINIFLNTPGEGLGYTDFGASKGRERTGRRTALSHRLSLSRAAHLVGVHRRTLQKMVGEGKLDAAEGQVTVEELRRAFPLADHLLERAAVHAHQVGRSGQRQPMGHVGSPAGCARAAGARGGSVDLGPMEVSI